MFSCQSKRCFGSSSKTICILANSKQADLIGSKIIHNLKVVSNDKDIKFVGYGGMHMQKEGMHDKIEFDVGELFDKTFHTFRKAKTFSEAIYYRWNFINLINKHYTRNTN